MTPQEQKKRFVIAYPPSYVKEKLEKYTEQTGASKSEVISDALKQYLNKVNIMPLKK